MRKVIGVMPLYDAEKKSYWIQPRYLQMLEAENAIPLVLPLTTNHYELDYFIEICGGFLLSGGHDVSPAVYREERKPWCGSCCEARDEMEQYILKKAVEADRSVLGICRGIQLMNVCYDGTLYQDLKTEYGTCINHRIEPSYDKTVHMNTIQKDTPLYDILGKEHIRVNSYHHQAIKTLSPQFKQMAISEDGLIESIYMPACKYVVGVQWHPEYSYQLDEYSRILVHSFVDSIQGC